MKLTMSTFEYMIKNIRAIYGPAWRSDLEDQEVRLIFFATCQELIAEELVDEFLCVYRTHREVGPRSPYDIIVPYIDKQLAYAKSSEFIIEKIVTSIKDYEHRDTESVFSDRDDFLFNNVFPMLPCSTGIKEFYVRNRKKFENLARGLYDDYDEARIYEVLGKDYNKQLVNAERKAIIKQINRIPLPTTQQKESLEA